MSHPLSRRDFINRSAQTACAITLGSLIIDLALVSRSKARLLDDDTIILTCIEYPDLSKVGGVTIVEARDGDIQILVARIAEKKFAAVGLKCTHLGCELKYDDENKNFLCPCHGSSFGLDGAVLKGPAKKNVAYYPTTFNEEKNEVTLSLQPLDAGAVPNDTKNVIDSTKVDSTQGTIEKPK